MKVLFRLLLLPFVTASLAAANFQEHIGLQLWSLRTQMQENPRAALDLAKSYGITEVETAGTGNLSVTQFAAELRSRGLKAVSAHFSYDALKKDLSGSIRDAKTLGVRYLIVPSLPRGSEFTATDARRIAADFNAFGAACQAEGIRFGYHPHGFEFETTGTGRGELVFDVLVNATDPDLVCFQMDVFWIFHAGQDPVRMLNKYPTRWALLHLKDIRHGAVTGLSTGTAAPIDNVTVGTGQIDWPGVLQTAQEVGVEHYFLEDETPTPLQCIPDSLKFLRGLKL